MNTKSLSILLMSILFMGAYFAACGSIEMRSAKSYLQENNLESAEEQALLAVENETANPLPSYWLGMNIYAQQERWEEMRAMFDKSLSISPKFAAEIENQSEFHWINEFNEGANLFNEVLNGESSNADSSLSAAIKSFEEATLIIPGRAQAYATIASIYLHKEDAESAKMYLIKSAELDSTDIKSLINLAIIYSKENDYEKGDSYLNKVLELDPGNLTALQQLAQNFDSQGKSEEAEATYQKALKADPENANLMYNLGVIYLKADNYEKAEEMFLGSLKSNPDDCDAISNVAAVYTNLEGRLADAENYLLKAVDCAPTENVYWRQLVGIYMKMGKPDKAQNALDKAKELGYKP